MNAQSAAILVLFEAEGPFTQLMHGGIACYDSDPMPLRVLQRPDWHGTPRELGELFILHKNRSEARAMLLTHQLGWEVRLLIGAQPEVVQTQVCRSQEEVLSTGEQWKAR